MIEAHIQAKVQPFFDKISHNFCIPYHIFPNMVTLAVFITGIVTAFLKNQQNLTNCYIFKIA